MGRYATLTAAAGYLKRFTTLDATQQSDSEAAADRQVDDILEKWDRTAWQGDAVPPEVADAALKISTGEYLMRSFAANNSSGLKDSLGYQLVEGGRKQLKDIVERGGPILVGGDRQAPKQNEDLGGSMLVRIRR